MSKKVTTVSKAVEFQENPNTNIHATWEKIRSCNIFFYIELIIVFYAVTLFVSL